MISLLTSISLWIMNLEMFPLFDIAHDYLAAVDIRDAWGAHFARTNPICAVVSWAVTIACIYAGSIIANYLTGNEVLAALSDIPLLMLASFVWFAVCYSPYDIVYRFGEIFAIKLIMHILKEIYRAKKVRNAVFQMWYSHPSLFITKIVIGVIRGNGAGVVKQIWNITRKIISPGSAVSIETSFTTKSCFFASAIYFLEFEVDSVPVSRELIHLGVVLLFIIGKISTLVDSINFDKIAKKDKTSKTMKKTTKHKTEKKTN